MVKRIILAITGASGMPYAATLARELSRRPDIELHLILSDAARTVLAAESDIVPDELLGLAHRSHDPGDMAAPPASGSWLHHGMIVCPCSMNTLAGVANSMTSNLIHRAADVCLKERRPLVLVVRETPLGRGHLRNMLLASEAGAVIMPACPGFYHRPASLDDLVRHLAGRILDQLHIPHHLSRRWGEQAI